MNAFGIAWDSIWHHRTRSLLTALGVVIGVFAVVTLTSLGGGVKTYVTSQFSTFGANIVTVLPASPHSSSGRTGFGHGGPGAGHHGGGALGGIAPSTLTLGDVTALEHANSRAISAVVPIALVPDLISQGSRTASQASILGTSPAYFGAEHLVFAAGHFPRGSASGVVLGSKLATDLFGRGSALGRTVTIGSRSEVVTGVLKASGNLFGANPDATAYIPATQAIASAPGHTLSEILVIAHGNSQVNAATSAARTILLKRHPAHNFSLTTSQQILSTVEGTLSVVTSFLAGIAGISLLVGGIGIMNIMLVTVAERFREIGVRKALGARDGDILLQFLTESVLLALCGGIVGMLFSALATHIVGKAVGIPADITGSSVALAMGFSVVVGAVFGVLPAMRAARLTPAEALRSD